MVVKTGDAGGLAGRVMGSDPDDECNVSCKNKNYPISLTSALSKSTISLEPILSKFLSGFFDGSNGVVAKKIISTIQIKLPARLSVPESLSERSQNTAFVPAKSAVAGRFRQIGNK